MAFEESASLRRGKMDSSAHKFDRCLPRPILFYSRKSHPGFVGNAGLLNSSIGKALLSAAAVCHQPDTRNRNYYSVHYYEKCRNYCCPCTNCSLKKILLRA